MTAGPWEHFCVMSLAKILAAADTKALVEWIGEHVGYDDELWERFAVTLAGLASAGLEFDARRGLGGFTGEIVFAPEFGTSAEHVDRLAVQLVTMTLNEDHAGVLGVIAAVRAAGDMDSFCGSLGSIASRALSGTAVRVVHAERGDS